MPAPLLIPLGIKAVCWCGTLFGFGYCVKKAHDAYSKGQKTKQQRLALKGKSIEQAREENKRLNTRNQELEDKLKQGENKEKEIEKQISDIKKLQKKRRRITRQVRLPSNSTRWLEKK